MSVFFSGRQKVMRAIYPLLMKVSRLLGKSKVVQNNGQVPPPKPVYDLSVTLNNGTHLPLQSLQGKKVLVVNTASNCGYTAQYAELQQLQKEHPEDLVVIGFPANDFKEQEAGGDADIAQFCQVNFGVTFPLSKKTSVVQGSEQHPLYKWLTQPEQNGWNNQPPSWNFSKYLLNEQGVLTHYFDPAVSPLSNEVKKAVQEK
jgi:glutathione peroxidase